MKEVLNDIYTDGCKEKKYRLSDFFNRWWDEYAQHPAEYITPEQYKAVNAIRVCRTTALGIDTYVCPDCGEVREISHSCKHRFCPSCGWRDTLKWDGTHERKDAAGATPPCGDDLAAYPAGLGEAQQERNAEYTDAYFG